MCGGEGGGRQKETDRQTGRQTETERETEVERDRENQTIFLTPKKLIWQKILSFSEVIHECNLTKMACPRAFSIVNSLMLMLTERFAVLTYGYEERYNYYTTLT